MPSSFSFVNTALSDMMYLPFVILSTLPSPSAYQPPNPTHLRHVPLMAASADGAQGADS